MTTTTKSTDDGLWHYHCSECGMGNGETGYHVPMDVIYCELCMEDGQHVRRSALAGRPRLRRASG